jgi:hypothetical protein
VCLNVADGASGGSVGRERWDGEELRIQEADPRFAGFSLTDGLGEIQRDRHGV